MFNRPMLLVRYAQPLAITPKYGAEAAAWVTTTAPRQLTLAHTLSEAVEIVRQILTSESFSGDLRRNEDVGETIEIIALHSLSVVAQLKYQFGGVILVGTRIGYDGQEARLPRDYHLPMDQKGIGANPAPDLGSEGIVLVGIIPDQDLEGFPHATGPLAIEPVPLCERPFCCQPM